ncbi:hypothetical protein OROMI_028078 [Orobanche minor]
MVDGKKVPFVAPIPVKYKRQRPHDLQNRFAERFDWRGRDVLQVKDQGCYNMCWAIAITHCVEAYHNSRNPQAMEEGSQQELVNEFLRTESKMTSVTDLVRVFKWILKNGLCKEKDSPWRGKYRVIKTIQE